MKYRLPIMLYFTVLLIIFNCPLYAARAPWVGMSLNGIPCPIRPQDDGPYDYLITSQLNKKKLSIISHHHLTREVLNHIKGKTTSIPADLDFAIRVFPNHHIALLSLLRYKIKLDKKIIKKEKWHPEPPAPIECYFQRALNFSAKDTTTMALYAYYLKKIGRLHKSAKIYRKAIRLAPNNSKIAYSYSLLLIKLKKYDEAVEQAKKAYQYGHPPNNLKNKLKKLGLWKLD